MKTTKEENQGLIKRVVGENQAIKKLLDRLRPPSQEPRYRSQKMRTQIFNSHQKNLIKTGSTDIDGQVPV